MALPTVAVVIPAFNPKPDLLAQAIASVRRQKYGGKVDLVVVDDGSATPVGQHDGARVVHQTNQGVCAARNAGAKLAHGELLAFLDQDDSWAPNKLRRQLAFMRAHQLDLCDTDFDIIRDGNLVAGGYADHGGTRPALLAGAGLGLSTLVVAREAFERVGGFDQAFPTVQDWDLVLRLLDYGYRFRRLPEVLVTYRLHDANASLDYGAAHRESSAIYRRYANLYPEAVRAGRRLRRERHAYQAIDGYRSTRHLRHLAWAMRYEPALTLRAVAKSLTKDGASARKQAAT